MKNLIKSILIILFIALLELLIYHFLLKPRITTWGATKEEISMLMAGDDKTLKIISTRAILINTKKSDVWKWLMQLGADRGGFYSYTLVEEAMGYKSCHQDVVKAEFNTLEVGSFVRGSIDEKNSIIPYNFRVAYVKPEYTLVLDNWGTFLLKELNEQQTRLIIRTQEKASSSPWLKMANYMIVPLHFIMERRTLIGIKARAEAGDTLKLSPNEDILWFSTIVLSGGMILCVIFLKHGVIRSMVIPCFFEYFLVMFTFVI